MIPNMSRIPCQKQYEWDLITFFFIKKIGMKKKKTKSSIVYTN